jgi:hypothetical protein
LWQSSRRVSIIAIDENCFMFQFYDLLDVERVFQEDPWMFDNFILFTRKLSFDQHEIVKQPWASLIDSLHVPLMIELKHETILINGGDNYLLIYCHNLINLSFGALP